MKEYQHLRSELEERIGHAVPDGHMQRKMENVQRIRDSEIMNAVEATAPKPKSLCDYDWKDSHLADRSLRDLQEICGNSGMQGWGTKATMLKWLDTGSVEYEELSMTSLEQLCRERGVQTRSKDKRLDLARRMKDADEAE